ncbi:Crp/Fnr family transcriptional regulator [Chloroflexota bacterium]
MGEKPFLFNLLSTVDVFNKFNEFDRNNLADIAIEHRLSKGEMLTSQGDHWPEVILIKSGKLKWSLLAESGKEYTLFTLEPGNQFWGHTVFDDQPMPASIIALNSCILYSWKKDQIKPIISKYPDAMWDIGKLLVGIMRRNREVVINLAFRQVTGRLAKYLLDTSDDGSRQIDRDLTLDEISRMLGATPQVVCRALYDLQSQDILKITRAHITINHRENLNKLIEEV